MQIAVHLRWVDVDPARHPFDTSRLRPIVDAVLPERRTTRPDDDDDAEAVEGAIDRALLPEYGPWILGWRWATSEPGDGGVVKSYCCAAHSLVGSRAKMAGRVVGAVREWRYRLERLSAEYESIRRETQGLPDDAAVSRAAARLLPLILEWTGAKDAWYRTFARVLAWYLEPTVPDPDRAMTLVTGAIGGRFHSWLAPREDLSTAVIESVTHDVARELREGPPAVDALDVWMRHRVAVSWNVERLYAPGAVTRDGHRAYVETVDRERDPDRAARMLRALEEVRACARNREPLTFERVREWQRIVLGLDVDLRRSDAFAHGGGERYGLHPGIRARLHDALAEANDATVSVIGRAARVYLDVCYFHPFPDGNARAARLALDHVLTAAGLALHAAGPVFLVARRALDLSGAYSLVYTIDYLAGETATE